MSESMEEELARLRAENVRLSEENRVKNDQRAQQGNAGLMSLAAHARQQEAAFQMIQRGGLEVEVGEVTPLARDAAAAVMQDLGLV